jgi:hypothetical protein
MVKIEITINPADLRQVEAFYTLMKCMTPGAEIKPEPVAATEPAPLKKKAKALEPVKEVEPMEKLAEMVETAKGGPIKTEVEPLKPEVVEEVKTVDINEIRTVLAEKVGDNRPAIVAKLTELGAANLSTLDPKHHAAFHAFLTTL